MSTSNITHTFYFVRHGYSCANYAKDLNNRFTRYLDTKFDLRDPHLTDYGIIGSIDGGNKINNNKLSELKSIKKIYVSPLIRTWETAFLMFNGLEEKCKVAPYLKETNFGAPIIETRDNKPLSYEENKKRFNEFKKHLDKNTFKFKPPNTLTNYLNEIKQKKTFPSFDEKKNYDDKYLGKGDINKFIRWVINEDDKKPKEKYIVVAHGNIIREFLKKYTDDSKKKTIDKYTKNNNFIFKVDLNYNIELKDYSISRIELIAEGVKKPDEHIGDDIKKQENQYSLCKKKEKKDKKTIAQLPNSYQKPPIFEITTTLVILPVDNDKENKKKLKFYNSQLEKYYRDLLEYKNSKEAFLDNVASSQTYMLRHLLLEDDNQIHALDNSLKTSPEGMIHTFTQLLERETFTHEDHLPKFVINKLSRSFIKRGVEYNNDDIKNTTSRKSSTPNYKIKTNILDNKGGTIKSHTHSFGNFGSSNSFSSNSINKNKSPTSPKTPPTSTTSTPPTSTTSTPPTSTTSTPPTPPTSTTSTPPVKPPDDDNKVECDVKKITQYAGRIDEAKEYNTKSEFLIEIKNVSNYNLVFYNVPFFTTYGDLDKYDITSSKTIKIFHNSKNKDNIYFIIQKIDNNNDILYTPHFYNLRNIKNKDNIKKVQENIKNSEITGYDNICVYNIIEQRKYVINKNNSLVKWKFIKNNLRDLSFTVNGLKDNSLKNGIFLYVESKPIKLENNLDQTIKNKILSVPKFKGIYYLTTKDIDSLNKDKFKEIYIKSSGGSTKLSNTNITKLGVNKPNTKLRTYDDRKASRNWSKMAKNYENFKINRN